MNIVKVFILILLFSLTAMSSKKAPLNKHREIENELLNDKWNGEKKLIPLIKKVEKKPCEYLLKKLKEFKEVNFAKVRVLRTMTELKCNENSQIIQEEIASKNISVQAQAILMAAKLPIKDRQKIATPIRNLGLKSKDQYLKETIKTFEKSLKAHKKK